MPVSAKSLSIPSYVFRGTTQADYYDFYQHKGLDIIPRDGTIQKYSDYLSGELTKLNGEDITITTSYFIKDTTLPFITPTEDNIELIVDKLWYEQYLWYDDSKHFYHTPHTARALITYENGTMEYIDDVTVTGSGANKKVTVTFSPKKPINSFELIFTLKPTVATGKKFWIATSLGEWYSDDSFDIIVNESSEDTGLLKGIIEWLKGIKEGITNLFNSIAELPSKLWNLISEGLKSLFVPTENDITTFKNNMQGLLSEKLGAVYQVLDITFNSWDRIQDNDNTDTITLPKTTIELGNQYDGSIPYSFGGVNVKIVPDGFEWLATTIKSIIGIVCTVLFVNGLRKRYDDVMGG